MLYDELSMSLECQELFPGKESSQSHGISYLTVASSSGEECYSLGKGTFQSHRISYLMGAFDSNEASCWNLAHSSGGFHSAETSDSDAPKTNESAAKMVSLDSSKSLSFKITTALTLKLAGGSLRMLLYGTYPRPRAI